MFMFIAVRVADHILGEIYEDYARSYFVLRNMSYMVQRGQLKDEVHE